MLFLDGYRVTQVQPILSSFMLCVLMTTTLHLLGFLHVNKTERVWMKQIDG